MVRVVKKAEVRRLEILEAAQHLFQTQEYDNTTIQDVIDYLGVAKGTLYHYYKSKEELLEAVVEHMAEKSIAQMQVVVNETQGSAVEKIGRLIAAGRIVNEDDQILEHLHHSGNVGMHTRMMAVALIKSAPFYAEVVRQGNAEGVFHVDHPLECAEFILAGIQFITDTGIYPWSQADLIRRMQALPGLIEAQLQAPAGSFQFLLIPFSE
ncbi:MAG TPA: TetR/AcrR family transcriptional regulator [Anaerolineaceae bacterium]|nr:TetR/AcrR family transcriptional regulator [Anaerolineaceae bacterium]